ncbi:MAG: TatD family hydrolase [Thermoleophilia bacterium]|nr:TatD family hydrolase [Thermoleophilia bacterium]
MIDTHAHLDACDGPAAVLLERARSAGVRRVVTVGSGLASCRAALALAEAHEGVVAALGVHPHQARDARPDDLGELRGLLAHPRAVAVGETGLDYFRDYAPRDAQRALFDAQIALAVELGKALVVHSRAAEEDTLAALARVPPGGPPVVLHCFSSPGLLPAALERGYYVSFAGNVTYPKADALRLAAARVPAERILAETDCPYLAPQPVRGERNEPANVVHVLDALARARGQNPGALERQLEANAAAAFGLP